jgi:hypothetical protein
MTPAGRSRIPIPVHEDTVKTLDQRISTGLGMLTFLSLSFRGNALTSDTDKCNAITSAPVTISTPGVYCLTADIILPNTFTSGTAITVASDT